MSRQDILLTSCRYYKGGEECPYESGSKALFWPYEKKWLEMFLNESDTLVAYRDEYEKGGLPDFEDSDLQTKTAKMILNHLANYFCSINYMMN